VYEPVCCVVCLYQGGISTTHTHTHNMCGGNRREWRRKARAIAVVVDETHACSQTAPGEEAQSLNMPLLLLLLLLVLLVLLIWPPRVGGGEGEGEGVAV
jgi:disulfide bond formation protein DsbB